MDPFLMLLLLSAQFYTLYLGTGGKDPLQSLNAVQGESLVSVQIYIRS